MGIQNLNKFKSNLSLHRCKIFLVWILALQDLKSKNLREFKACQ